MVCRVRHLLRQASVRDARRPATAATDPCLRRDGDLLRPALYDAWHRIEAARQTEGKIIAEVVGPVCESGDFLAHHREIDDVHPGDLLITLLRSVGELSRNDLPTRPGHAGWPTPTPAAQCRGTTVVELALALITTADLAEPDRLEQLWEDAFLPVRAWWLRDYAPVGPERPRPQGIALEGAGLVFSACQAAEDGRGMILRCWNALERPTSGFWRCEQPVLRASRIRADGVPLEDMTVTADGHRLGVEAWPREIVTVLVTFTD